MHRPLAQMIVFLGIVLLVVGGSHYLLWSRLVRSTDLQAPWRMLATSAIVALGLSLPVGLIASRTIDAQWTRAMAAVSFTWLGLLFLLLLGIGVSELLQFGHRLQAGLPDPDRRLFLARLLGGGAAGVALLAGAGALRSALRSPELLHVTVKLRRLPIKFNGLSIVQVSDLHVGPTIRKEDVQDLVQRINALKPDIVALTGDLVDGPVSMLREQIAPFADVKSTYGTFLVTGNHEYYSGVDEWLAEWRKLGVKPLRNERVTIGHGENSFELAGVDDWTAHNFGGDHGHDMPKALKGHDPKREIVLLAHQPKSIVEAAKLGVGLQLSGHTHGGQIWPFHWLVKLVQPYVAGLDKHGDTWIYVSRGTGYWGPPMRLAAPSELTRIVLHADLLPA